MNPNALSLTATAVAHPNIAFIKYWGNRNQALRLPVNGSISMNLSGLTTHTTVTFDASMAADELALNGCTQSGAPLERVSRFLDHVRGMAGFAWRARVVSENNFPTGAGIASSAAAFAALSLAASNAAGLKLSETALSRLARLGSGSACRSVPSGFVEWQAGEADLDSYAVSIAPPEHWDLVDCIAVVRSAHKPVGSSEGHQLAATSPLQNARVVSAALRLELCRAAILKRDFSALAEVTELDSNVMHAVMMTSDPPLFYWAPESLRMMEWVRTTRHESAWPVCYTLDAGPNVHIITTAEFATTVCEKLTSIEGVQQVLTAHPGGPARLVKTNPAT